MAAYPHLSEWYLPCPRPQKIVPVTAKVEDSASYEPRHRSWALPVGRVIGPTPVLNMCDENAEFYSVWPI